MYVLNSRHVYLLYALYFATTWLQTSCVTLINAFQRIKCEHYTLQSWKHCAVIDQWHLVNADLSASGSHSWESVSKTKWQRLLKQRSMIGSNKPKDYHNKQPQFQEELKKECHKTSLFRVESSENLVVLPRFWTRHGYKNFAAQSSWRSVLLGVFRHIYRSKTATMLTQFLSPLFETLA